LAGEWEETVTAASRCAGSSSALGQIEGVPGELEQRAVRHMRVE